MASATLDDVWQATERHGQALAELVKLGKAHTAMLEQILVAATGDPDEAERDNPLASALERVAAALERIDSRLGTLEQTIAAAPRTPA